jgi:mono/diheme cytochrome c family protein
MTRQAKARTYSATTQRAFAAGAVAPAGAVAVVSLESMALETFHTATGYVKEVPFAVDAALLERGRERFGIYCSACHDDMGAGHGIIARKGFPSPVDLAGANAAKMLDGQLFEVETRGIRNMPAPAEPLDARERWAIVAWVRVLQRSGSVTPLELVSGRASVVEPLARRGQ